MINLLKKMFTKAPVKSTPRIEEDLPVTQESLTNKIILEGDFPDKKITKKQENKYMKGKAKRKKKAKKKLSARSKSLILK